jgi:hypothetical protein
MVKSTVVLVTIALVVGSALAWASSAMIGSRAEMTIPALTSLMLPGTTISGRDILVSVEVLPTTIASSGDVELKRAVVLVVRSNVPWTLAVWPTDRLVHGVVEVRTERGEYRPLGPGGLVLATGRPGVHEIVLDYRVALGEAGWTGGRWLTLAYGVKG